MNLHQQHLIEDAIGRDLTEDEIDEIREAFNLFDTDGMYI